MTKKTTRINVTVPVSTKEAIKALADRMEVSESAAAQHLIQIGLTQVAIALSGGKITTRYPPKEVEP